jgi:hypothetical protein
MMVIASRGMYQALATVVLIVHVFFILWVVLGALIARSHPLLRILHIASLVWAVVAELYASCPLTLLENWLEQQAGIAPYQGGFLLHYLDKLVYPDIPATVLTVIAVIVCVLNLVYYARLIWTRTTRPT